MTATYAELASVDADSGKDDALAFEIGFELLLCWIQEQDAAQNVSGEQTQDAAGEWQGVEAAQDQG